MAYKHLTDKQRLLILALHKKNHSQAKIAEFVGVNQSTICREIKNNNGVGGYNCAHPSLFTPKQKIKNAKKHKMTPAITRIVEMKIKEKWSPEQISGWLKETILFSISHQTIYEHIRADRKAGGELYLHTRRKGKKYRKNGSSRDRSRIKHRKSIDDRPKHILLRKIIGHWEMDTMIGKAHSGVIVTIVERKTRYTLSARVNAKSAEAVTKAIIALLEPYKDVVETITADNGNEFAHHKEIALAVAAIVYFCHPHSSHERGSNENTNGLLRQYWPKNTDFKAVSDNEVVEVVKSLNDRPRLSLGFKSPAQVMLADRQELKH